MVFVVVTHSVIFFSSRMTPPAAPSPGPIRRPGSQSAPLTPSQIPGAPYPSPSSQQRLQHRHENHYRQFATANFARDSSDVAGRDSLQLSTGGYAADYGQEAGEPPSESRWFQPPATGQGQTQASRIPANIIDGISEYVGLGIEDAERLHMYNRVSLCIIKHLTCHPHFSLGRSARTASARICSDATD